MQVTILERKEAAHLEGEIEAYIANGWELSGDPVVTSGNRFSRTKYIQRMVKHKSPPPSLQIPADINALQNRIVEMEAKAAALQEKYDDNSFILNKLSTHIQEAHTQIGKRFGWICESVPERLKQQVWPRLDELENQRKRVLKPPACEGCGRIGGINENNSAK